MEASELFNKELDTYAAADKVLSSLVNTKAVKPFDMLVAAKFLPSGVAQKQSNALPLSYIFDETGLPHDWSKKVLYIFAVEGKDRGPELALSGKDVTKARVAGDTLNGATLVDLQCPECSARWSEINKLDTAKVEKMVVVAKNMQSFFECFESRCPVMLSSNTYSLHKWKTNKNTSVSDSSCEHCGLSGQTLLKAGLEGVKFSLAVKNADALAYYEKYADVFQQARGKIAASMASISESRQTHKDLAANDACTDAAAAWKPNYTFLMRASEAGQVTPALIEAFGATKGRYYTDILNGVNPPGPPSRKTDPRIFVADAAGRSVARELSRLCAVWRLPVPAAWAAEMLEKAKVPASEFGTVDQLFMPIARDLASCARNNLFTSIVNGRAPETALQYATETFCRIVCDVLDAAAGEPEYIQEVARLFAYRSVQKVAHSAKILSKNEWFNFNLFTENPETDSALDSIEDEPEAANITEEGGENDVLDAARQIDFDITDNGGDDS